jgi:hypothetical protein
MSCFPGKLNLRIKLNDDKKELIDPPRIQEKEFEEPERISLRTPKDLELKKQS